MLLELQKLDLKCDEIRASKEAIDNNLADVNRVLEQLRDDLDGQVQQLEATEQLQKDKAAEHLEAEERYKKSKGRLAKVANTKEYSAIEQEIENAKKLAAQLEEELLQLAEAINASRAATAEKESKIKALSDQVSQEAKQADDHLRDLDKDLDDMTRTRGTMAKDIAKDVMRRYTFIRSRRDGVAIVAARNGCCQGCFMQLPPQLYIELQRGDALTSCPSCQRILFFIDGQDSTGERTA
jgi:predicted  nucleic acid-binding Zn-ribbon protein